MLAPPELRAVHPLGKSPVITDGDITLAETGAIVEWIIERYGQGRMIPPAGTPDRVRYSYWLHYAEGSAMPPLLLKLIFGRLASGSPLLLRGVVGQIAGKVQATLIDPQLKAHADYWEAELSKSGWFAGPEFTAADVMMSFPLEAGASRGGALDGRPKVKAFLEKIHARPAYRRALEKGGPYAYAS
jgi:glutathione S-transferase